MVFYMVMPTDCDYVPINIDEFIQSVARIESTNTDQNDTHLSLLAT